jgi:hypothetical protein
LDAIKEIYMSEINMESLFNTFTSEEQVKESFDKFTAPTGRYKFTAIKVTPMEGVDENAPDSIRKALGDRKYVRVFGRMTEMVEGVEKKRGSVGFEASWEPRKTDKGMPDKATKLWGQLVVALDMKQKSVGEVLNAIQSYPLSIYVNESFKTPEGYRTAKDAEDRKAYRSLGYESKNFVESISRA